MLFVPVTPAALVDFGKLFSNTTSPSTLLRTSSCKPFSSHSAVRRICGETDCFSQASMAFSKRFESSAPISGCSNGRASGISACTVTENGATLSGYTVSYIPTLLSDLSLMQPGLLSSQRHIKLVRAPVRRLNRSPAKFEKRSVSGICGSHENRRRRHIRKILCGIGALVLPPFLIIVLV